MQVLLIMSQQLKSNGRNKAMKSLNELKSDIQNYAALPLNRAMQITNINLLE